MAEMHKLFEQRFDEKEAPEVEEIGVINVARLVGTRMIPDGRTYRPDELPDLEAFGKTFGSGEYVIVARRAQQGPKGERAGSIYRRVHGMIVGAEYGPPKRCLDGPPVQQNGQANGAPAPSNGGGGFPAGIPGVPSPDAMRDPFMMMMWMQHMSAERDRQARLEQIERDRINEERREAEAKRQHELTLTMIQQGMNKPDPNGGVAAALPGMFASFAQSLKEAHAPPAAPVQGPTTSQIIADFKAMAEASKALKPNDDIELVKAIGQGLSGLGGLGSLLGGGLTGVPSGG